MRIIKPCCSATHRKDETGTPISGAASSVWPSSDQIDQMSPSSPKQTLTSLHAAGRECTALSESLLPLKLTTTPDGLCSLSDTLFRGLLVCALSLHVAEDTVPLHPFFEHPKCLVDIVIANRYLQNFSCFCCSPFRRISKDVLANLFLSV